MGYMGYMGPGRVLGAQMGPYGLYRPSEAYLGWAGLAHMGPYGLGRARMGLAHMGYMGP